jgi:hypothetical protein
MTIEELLRDPTRQKYAAMPESDALTEVDALTEADLLDIRLMLSEVSVALLFDLRNALGFRMADAAALVMRGVRQVESTWGEPPRRGRYVHAVMSSKPTVNGHLFAFELGCLGGALVRTVAASAEFFVGDIPGLPEAPPDFIGDDESTIAAGMPNWHRTFEPEWATFIDPLRL